MALFTNHVRDREVSSRRNVCGVLRSFLRFGHQKGYLERDLAEVVPQIRRYRMFKAPSIMCSIRRPYAPHHETGGDKRVMEMEPFT